VLAIQFSVTIISYLLRIMLFAPEMFNNFI